MIFFWEEIVMVKEKVVNNDAVQEVDVLVK